MKFLKILLWLGVAVLVGMLAGRNWRDVTLDLWGDVQADIKIPILMLLMWLLGFLPAWLVYRTRQWSKGRRDAAPAAATPTSDDQAQGDAF